MPIYEFYCPDNNRLYQFFAKTRAQAESTPACPDNPAFRMIRVPSTFAIGGATRKSKDEAAAGGRPPGEGGAPGPDPERAPPGAEPDRDRGGPDEAAMDAALDALEGDLDGLDENDPRQMARMMRKMSELTREPLDEQMEEVVRKLEEGTDPDQLEEQMGDAFGRGEGEDEDGGGAGWGGRSPSRDPNLYDY